MKANYNPLSRFGRLGLGLLACLILAGPACTSQEKVGVTERAVEEMQPDQPNPDSPTRE